jgi:hypothetical protein
MEVTQRRYEMSKVNFATANKFLDHLELPAAVRGGFKAVEEKSQGDFDALKNQAMVVGSEVVSFVKGVSAERRIDIINCALLAQLAADHKVKDRDKIFEWYDSYFTVLTNLGWVIQDKGFTSYEENVDGLEAHEAILKVATVLLGGAPTALAIVISTIEAMKSMDADNPWITIFDRESRSAKTARFQIALVEEDNSGQFMVSLMAFGLKADSTLTQILFFKIRSDKVTFKHCSGKVTINEMVLAGIREKIRVKLIGRTGGYIDSLDLD